MNPLGTCARISGPLVSQNFTKNMHFSSVHITEEFFGQTWCLKLTQINIMTTEQNKGGVLFSRVG